ncbi:MAG: NAD(P)-binding domain-containing protein, partial [bacterium]
MKIAVLGAGSWGTALAIILANNDHSVTLWSHKQEYADVIRTQRINPSFLPGITIPEKIDATSDLMAAVSAADMIVCAVPS